MNARLVQHSATKLRQELVKRSKMREDEYSNLCSQGDWITGQGEYFRRRNGVIRYKAG
jgi:phosphotransferase system IIB component